MKERKKNYKSLRREAVATAWGKRDASACHITAIKSRKQLLRVLTDESAKRILKGWSKLVKEIRVTVKAGRKYRKGKPICSIKKAVEIAKKAQSDRLKASRGAMWVRFRVDELIEERRNWRLHAYIPLSKDYARLREALLDKLYKKQIDPIIERLKSKGLNPEEGKMFVTIEDAQRSGCCSMGLERWMNEWLSPRTIKRGQITIARAFKMSRGKCKFRSHEITKTIAAALLRQKDLVE